ncbi:hypothetical protein LW002 [Lumpy skin disease virus]|uniref:LSDV155 n=1 Tax=Lumpy skin disease virus TaxID=59509 RepID=A0A3G4YJC5_LSDV|nr:hypothetical protein LW002 [Lumpy skin disease virus]
MLCIFYIARLCNLIIYSLYSLLMFPMQKLISFMFGNLNPFDSGLDKDEKIQDNINTNHKPIESKEINNDLPLTVLDKKDSSDINIRNDNGVFDFIKIPNPFKKHYEYYCNQNTIKEPPRKGLVERMMKMVEKF